MAFFLISTITYVNITRRVFFTSALLRRRDGIGRRAGLKIPWWQHRIGSTPIAGTRSGADFAPSKIPEHFAFGDFFRIILLPITFCSALSLFAPLTEFKLENHESMIHRFSSVKYNVKRKYRGKIVQ